MSGPNAPASVPLSPRDPRAFRYWVALGITLGVLALALAGAVVVDTPYATLAPGSARSTMPLVEVDGHETYPSDGELLFLTVGVDGDVSLLEAAAAWADADVEVLPREQVFGEGVTEEENREQNARAMVGSKGTASVVALTRLGIPLEPTGTGAVVISVLEDAPAAEARLVPTDTIVAVDGEPVELNDQLAPLISARSPGDTVTLTVENEAGEAREVDVTLAAREDDAEAGFLGVTTDTRDFDPGLPFTVDIDSGRVGGPSAGLAFTLAILDVLTEGDLTGGHTVAVTGTILDDGTVGPVGGVVQKTAAAASAGAELMLVPDDEYEDAADHSHGMEIVAVSDLEEALDALEAFGGDALPPAPSPAA